MCVPRDTVCMCMAFACELAIYQTMGLKDPSLCYEVEIAWGVRRKCNAFWYPTFCEDHLQTRFVKPSPSPGRSGKYIVYIHWASKVNEHSSATGTLGTETISMVFAIATVALSCFLAFSYTSSYLLLLALVSASDLHHYHLQGTAAEPGYWASYPSAALWCGCSIHTSRTLY